MISINEKKVNYSQKHVVTFQLLIALEKKSQSRSDNNNNIKKKKKIIDNKKGLG